MGKRAKDQTTLTISLPTAMEEALREEAERKMTNMSTLVRQYLDAQLERLAAEEKRGAAAKWIKVRDAKR